MKNAWLDPLHHFLDRLSTPVSFFFRDDDAGWEHDRLLLLLDLFAQHRLPLDVAVIPQTLTPQLAHLLLARATDGSASIGLHQHGFAHFNHEASGRKCEFGVSRSIDEQSADIARGQQGLSELLGPYVDPIFTPPWNRCTGETGQCLRKLGFRILSRDKTATSLGISELRELPVTVDWFAHQEGIRLSREQLGHVLATQAAATAPVGIMFHHALMDEEERSATAALLTLLSRHPQVRCARMLAI